MPRLRVSLFLSLPLFAAIKCGEIRAKFYATSLLFLHATRSHLIMIRVDLWTATHQILLAANSIIVPLRPSTTPPFKLVGGDNGPSVAAAAI